MKFGIIGGSGLYNLPGLAHERWITPPTHAFGDPSDQFLHGQLGPHEVWFIPRHGRGHRLLPSEINHRANLLACKQLGVECILAVSAVGSLRRELEPGHLVLADQYIDRTRTPDRHTFFGKGAVGHVSFGDPICPHLRQHLAATATRCLKEHPGVIAHDGGTYVNIEGPSFSSRAESNLYRQWHADVVGMTSLAEARLAREAEICYALLAVVTDYDCWASDQEDVRADLVAENMKRSLEHTRTILTEAILTAPDRPAEDPCRTALDGAIMTPAQHIPAETRHALAPLLDRVLGG